MITGSLELCSGTRYCVYTCLWQTVLKAGKWFHPACKCTHNTTPPPSHTDTPLPYQRRAQLLFHLHCPQGGMMQLKGTCGTALRLTEILQDLLNLMRRCRVNQRTQHCTLWAVWVSPESMTPHSGREGGVGGRVEWERG